VGRVVERDLGISVKEQRSSRKRGRGHGFVSVREGLDSRKVRRRGKHREKGGRQPVGGRTRPTADLHKELVLEAYKDEFESAKGVFEEKSRRPGG